MDKIRNFSNIPNFIYTHLFLLLIITNAGEEAMQIFTLFYT